MSARMALLHLDPERSEICGAWVKRGDILDPYYPKDINSLELARSIVTEWSWDNCLESLRSGSPGMVGWDAVPCRADESAEQVFQRSGVIHPTYLPFYRGALRRHFAKVAGSPLPDARLHYYEQSALHALGHDHSGNPCVGALPCPPLAHQMEKDERFWVATALMSVFHSKDRVGALTRLLTECLGDVPPVPGVASWDEALGDANSLELFFEVHLNAPDSYKQYKRTPVEERVLTPWLRARAVQSKDKLEGATHADAMLIAPSTGFAVVFEAKVYSDASSHTTYDAKRNQIARNIDVLMDRNSGLRSPLNKRQPDRSCFVLITPEIFKRDPSSRLYGALMQAYRRDAELLHEHLPHRSPADLAGVPLRLGWTSWEQINTLNPGACPWLTAGPKAPTTAQGVEQAGSAAGNGHHGSGPFGDSREVRPGGPNGGATPPHFAGADIR